MAGIHWLMNWLIPSKIFCRDAQELLHEYRMKGSVRELAVVFCMEHFRTLDWSPSVFPSDRLLNASKMRMLHGLQKGH